MFAVAVENDLIPKNPCVPSLRVGGRETKKVAPLTPEQEELLLDAAKGTALYLFVLLGLNAGLRRGELLGLMWSDIDFEEGTLSIKRSLAATEKHPGGEISSTKTEASERTIPLHWSVVAELRRARAASRSVYVVPGTNGTYLSFPSLWYRWEALTKDLPFDVHPHQMRHTRITRWFEQGLDLKEIQYLAGHSTAKMTLDVYTHYQADVRIQETARKIREAT